MLDARPQIGPARLFNSAFVGGEQLLDSRIAHGVHANLHAPLERRNHEVVQFDALLEQRTPLFAATVRIHHGGRLDIGHSIQAIPPAPADATHSQLHGAFDVEGLVVRDHVYRQFVTKPHQ
ncbi:Uncharacterised protein [Bordetella pertussis]|nr:Uncharacterised protein [Bordetella pertussis]CFU81383.1 Uncharacterised protein [Bordetella pertussis]CPL82163.1 Uncharacterised protein [Bordetella pertussis]CPN45635.1 Uncharacterised protein [Bordetella pertussis]